MTKWLLIVTLLLNCNPLLAKTLTNAGAKRVGRIESNWVKDSQTGRVKLRQWILWRTGSDGQLHVADWKMIKPGQCVEICEKEYLLEWDSSKDGLAPYKVRSLEYRITTTENDPELADRWFLDCRFENPVNSPAGPGAQAIGGSIGLGRMMQDALRIGVR